MNEDIFFGEFETDEFIRDNFFSDYNYNGVMVEVGAGPPSFFSMSKHFRNNGWRCICIEPNPKFVQQHLNEGNEIYQFACSNEEKEGTLKVINTGWENGNDGISYSSLDVRYKKTPKISEKIPVIIKKLDSILEDIGLDYVDFVSVDTEGWEIDVMEGFDLNKYKPKVVLLENYEHNANYEIYMKKFGYSLIKKIKYNYIFSNKLI
jgi:FkbM family methyltransferase